MVEQAIHQDGMADTVLGFWSDQNIDCGERPFPLLVHFAGLAASRGLNDMRLADFMRLAPRPFSFASFRPGPSVKTIHKSKLRREGDISLFILCAPVCASGFVF